MNPTELRIGNLTSFGKVITIGQSSFYTINLEGTEVKSSWADIQPLKLTEDWLLKFGFISNPYRDSYDLNGFFIDCDKTKGYLELHFQYIELKYVHQLQNLYFALTNNELILK